ncbi:hypothetical protein CLOM_g18033 [Closterium sp. NIES-68]|nr:hypothetical protein CLOM_g18033 [Closterium sp. NIES-68]GJP64574.1 hypothetical protein CLOP_g21552 [Closterium sp. NIES-67]
MTAKDENAGHAADPEPITGEVLFCGGTDWHTIGRSDAKSKGKGKGAAAAAAAKDAARFPLLTEPHRLAPLKDVRIVAVATGCAAAHCLAVDADGRCYSWGRNECGQLAHGHLTDLNQPTIIEALAGTRIVAVASGRNHSLAVAQDGSAWAWGSNKYGQLGIGSLKTENEKKPVQSTVKAVRTVACGAEFSCWITTPSSTPSSTTATPPSAAAAAPSEPPCAANLLTAGLPQYGQLGHGTDNEYNAKDSSVKLVYAPQPTPRTVAALAGREMTKVACGTNHTVAVDSKGFVFTWGFGGFGRLGHKEQKDEWRPRLVDVFQRQNTLPATAVVAAGGAFSACTAGGGQLYVWGKVKQTGDCWMYPKPLLDLSGWHIRSMACGPATSCVAADASTISWGMAQHGELGYGPKGAKSSANPKKIDALEGMHSIQVAGGVGFFLHLVSRTGAPDATEEKRKKAGELLAGLPVFTPEADSVSQSTAKGKAAGTKKASKKVAKGQAAGDEEEDEDVEEVGGDEEEEEEEEEESEGEEEESEGEEEESEGEEESASKKRKGRGGRGSSAGAKKGRGAAAAAGKGRGAGKRKAAAAVGAKGKAARGRGKGKRK